MDASERRDRATEEAARWWAVVGNKSPAEVSESDRRDFTVWLRESPLHIAELLRIAHVDDTLRSFGSWDEIPGGTEEQADSNVVRLTRPAGGGAAAAAAADNPAPARNVNLRRRFAMAASIVVAVTVAGWFGFQSRDTVLSTDRAERREVMLADGSTVSLGPETQVRVGLSKTERHLTLERGRALFRVAKDPQRPFLVTSEGTVVRAVGTIFAVEQAEDNVIVTVKEGKVAVSPTAPARMAHSQSMVEQPDVSAGVIPAPAFLTSNEQMTVRAGGASSPVREVDASRALAWSEGLLVFSSTPLDEVAHRFNQYNRVQIRIRDAELGRRPVSGVFQASDPQTFIDFIRAGARVSVTRPSGGEIVVSSSGATESTPNP
jgi:transmembrane sensor